MLRHIFIYSPLPPPPSNQIKELNSMIDWYLKTGFQCSKSGITKKYRLIKELKDIKNEISLKQQACSQKMPTIQYLSICFSNYNK